ncbi:NUDIX domain-containing protein [Legionella fairfieldensis]|uniref:NUDIX domain-containing protein n=1 Tax=Legionella fairfieldensis TaxID=45064 RepID=UPI000490227C|nr:NUDIX domain-containing protein [Legionella fairfieldensis]
MTRQTSLPLNLIPMSAPDLNDFTSVESLGGGTGSTYKITNPVTKQSYVLKHGSHIDAMKLEVLCNSIYQALGVPVPKFCAYTEIPTELSKALHLNSSKGLFQISEYLDSDRYSKEELMKTAAQHFVAHALLGNIDVALESNFKGLTLIDSGANFLFRALGKVRKENPSLASEINTLRDANINANAYKWFSGLSDEEIAHQVKKCTAASQALEKIIWENSTQLSIPNDLRNDFLQYFSDRLDNLTTRYCPEEQSFAKSDKKANTENTAAGILTYQMVNNQWCVLLAKRARHNWWDNFGGKSDMQDTYLYETAIREVREESNKVLDYGAWDLVQSPFHDIVTETKEGDAFVYRMYIAPSPNVINLTEIRNEEHTDYKWVPIKLILEALQANKVLQQENQTTIQIEFPQSKKNLVIYPPLYQMLNQPPVKKHLEQLSEGKKLSLTHTQSKLNRSALNEGHVFHSPAMVKSQIASTLLSYSYILKELKRKNTTESNPVSSISLSQSELYLKAFLGNGYQADCLKANIRNFFNQFYKNVRYNKFSTEQQESLITQCMQLIAEEKKHSEDYFYAYHACDSKVAFAYRVFSALYEVLQAQDNWKVFRASQYPFKNFPTLHDFLAHYSPSGHDVTNYDDTYPDCVLSANLFLFGNHTEDSSCSISYLLDDRTNQSMDLEALFQNIFQPFNISQEEINSLLTLYDREAKTQGGALYQIGIPKRQVPEVIHPATGRGGINAYAGLTDVTDIVTRLQEDLFSENASKALNYMEKIQARIFCPPSMCLKINEISLQEVKISFKRSINNLIYAILKNSNELNKDQLDNKSSLLRILPSIYQTNQVEGFSANEHSLAKAIVKEDIVLVKMILKYFPELKDSKLKIPKEYVGDFSSSSSTSIAPLAMMVTRSKFTDEILSQCYEKEWWKLLPVLSVTNFDVLTATLKKIPDSEKLVMATNNRPIITNGWRLSCILNNLLIEDRLQFAKNNEDKINNDYELHQVLKELSSTDRFNFTTYHREKIKEGINFKDILLTLTKKERLNFIEQNEEKINNELLVSSLGTIPIEERYALALKYQEKIQDALDLSRIIKVLADDDKLKFMTLHKNKIHTVSDVHLICQSLPSDEKLNFVIPYLDKEKSFSFADFFRQFNKKDSYEFAMRYQNHMQDGSLYFVLEVISDSHERLEFAIKYKNKIGNAWLFSFVLNALDEKSRISYVIQNDILLLKREYLVCFLANIPNNKRLCFAHQYSDSIVDGEALSQVLDRLDKEDRGAFATQYQNKIQNGNELCNILRVIPEQIRWNFAKSNQYKINNGYELSAVLGTLTEEQRFDFAQQFGGIPARNCSYPKYAFNSVLRVIPIQKRLEYAFLHPEQINVFGDLEGICETLSQCEHFLDFIISHKDKITTCKELSIILKFLPENHQLLFATLHQNKVTDSDQYGDQFMNVIECLPLNQRFDFALQNKTRLREKHFCYVINYVLPTDKRLVFALENISRITTLNSFKNILKHMPAHYRLEFALACQNFVRSCATLIEVLNLLPRNNQLEFACLFIKKMTFSEVQSQEVAAALLENDGQDFLQQLTRASESTNSYRLN